MDESRARIGSETGQDAQAGQGLGRGGRRRSEARIACDRAIAMTRCAEPGNGAALAARLTDCSLHGLGLMMSDSVESGQPVLVTVDPGGQELQLMYTIRYCIPMQINRYRAGARFTGMAVSKFEGELSRVLACLTAGK